MFGSTLMSVFTIFTPLLPNYHDDYTYFIN